MSKHIIGVILASLLTVLLLPQFALILHTVAIWQQGFLSELTGIFSQSHLGHILQLSMTLILLPLLLTAIPATIYFAVKKQKMPHLFTLLWSLWLIFTVLVTLGR